MCQREPLSIGRSLGTHHTAQRRARALPALVHSRTACSAAASSSSAARAFDSASESGPRAIANTAVSPACQPAPSDGALLCVARRADYRVQR
jgi:hypothetical protein